MAVSSDPHRGLYFYLTYSVDIVNMVHWPFSSNKPNWRLLNVRQQTDGDVPMDRVHCLYSSGGDVCPEQPNETHSLHHGGLLGLQDVVREDPGHGHLDGELDPAAHREFQEELPEPELREIATLLQGLCAEEEEEEDTSPLVRDISMRNVSLHMIPVRQRAWGPYSVRTTTLSLSHSSQNDLLQHDITGDVTAALLTTEVQQVRVEEGLAVEALDVQDGGAFQAAAQSLLGATLVCDERLQHGPHHVELQGRDSRTRRVSH